MGNYYKQLNITIMERYDYLEAVKEDVLNYINENNIVVTSGNRDEVEQDLNDTLFTCDSVTGNASGSYTFNTWTAGEYLCHNWDLLVEALTEFGSDMSYLERGAEAYVVICQVKQFRMLWTKWKRRKRNKNVFCTSGNKVLGN